MNGERILAVGVCVLAIVITMLAFQCTSRRDNIISACIESERPITECALMRCLNTTADAVCAVSFKGK